MWLKWDLLDISGCTRVILRPLDWSGVGSAPPLPRKLQVELDQMTRGQHPIRFSAAVVDRRMELLFHVISVKRGGPSGAPLAKSPPGNVSMVLRDRREIGLSRTPVAKAISEGIPITATGTAGRTAE